MKVVAVGSVGLAVPPHVIRHDAASSTQVALLSFSILVADRDCLRANILERHVTIERLAAGLRHQHAADDPGRQ
jgi:hypothetical protein